MCSVIESHHINQVTVACHTTNRRRQLWVKRYLVQDGDVIINTNLGNIGSFSLHDMQRKYGINCRATNCAAWIQQLIYNRGRIDMFNAGGYDTAMEIEQYLKHQYAHIDHYITFEHTRWSFHVMLHDIEFKLTISMIYNWDGI